MIYDLGVEFRTAGIVLKKQSFGEADRIFRIFTRELGVLSALAKGVKKTTSRRGGCLELFGESDFRLYRRSGELFLVTEATAVSSFPAAKLASLKPAFEAAELLLTLAPPEKPLPKIYGFFQDFLRWLPRTKKPALLRLAFSTKVLRILGFLESGASFGGRERKLFKFLLERDFGEILKLREEKAIFQKAENRLREILERESGRVSRVLPATVDWR